MKSKRGTLVDENFIGIILAVAATVLLIFLMINLFSPSFDKEDGTAEFYFNMLKEAVNVADTKKIGSFSMTDYGGEGSDFYLVYFGELFRFHDCGLLSLFYVDEKEDDIILIRDYGKDIVCPEGKTLEGGILKILKGIETESYDNVKKEFIRDVKKNEKNLCICYSEENKVLCNYCMDLDLPVAFPDQSPWVLKEGSRVNISKRDVGYVFVKA